MRLKATITFEAWIDDNAIDTGDKKVFDISTFVSKYRDEKKARLAAEMAKTSGRDLDFIAEDADVIGEHKGPFTVHIDDDDYRKFVESGYDITARYIVTAGGYWGHFFDSIKGETMTEFVYDTEEEKLVAALLQTKPSLDKWEPASASELADLEDSLKNAKSRGVEKPGRLGTGLCRRVAGMGAICASHEDVTAD